MKYIFFCFTLVGIVWSQSAGMFANAGESLISIDELTFGGYYHMKDMMVLL